MKIAASNDSRKVSMIQKEQVQENQTFNRFERSKNSNHSINTNQNIIDNSNQTNNNYPLSNSNPNDIRPVSQEIINERTKYQSNS